MKLPWQKEPQQPLRSGYADYEPLISDRRMQAIASLLVEQFRARGLPDDSDFVTFVQPAQMVEREGLLTPIPEVGVFAVISDNPRSKGHRLMTQGSVWLTDWQAQDAASLSFTIGPNDPALPIFKAVMRSHLERLANLKAMN